jgi:hypothetical protein
MCVLVQDLEYAHSISRRVTLPKDMVRWEANHVYSDWLRAPRQKRWAWSAARATVRAWGEDTPSESESSRGDNKEEDEDREEGR